MKFSYFDAHCDAIWRCDRTGTHLTGGPGHIDLDRTGCFSRYAQVFAIFYDGAQPLPGGRWAETQRLHGLFRAELARAGGRIAFCRGRAETEAADRAALLSIEGGELLDCDPAHLAEAAAWGVQFLNLTWNHENALSGANRAGAEHGLSGLGRDFVRELRRCGIVPDVSHLSERGFWDLLELDGGPVAATHSNSAAVCPHPRNLTDDQFRALAQCGGVAGLNLYADFVGGGMDALLAHLEHFLELGGEDAVGFGADFDGCDPLFGGFTGVWDVPKIRDALAARGYPEALLQKLFYGNFLRLLRP